MGTQGNRLFDAIYNLIMIERDGCGTKDMKTALALLIHDNSLLMRNVNYYLCAYDQERQDIK